MAGDPVEGPGRDDGLELGFASRRPLRLIRQTEQAECGLACVAMIANGYGHNLDLRSLRRIYQPSLRGMTLGGLISLAGMIGLSGRAVRVELDQLGLLQLPAILHWDMNHFVVLAAVKGSRVRILNPSGSVSWLTLDQVSSHFTGVALEVEQMATFEPRRERASLRLWQLWSSIRGLKQAVVQTILLTVVMQAFVLISPYFLRIAIDRVIPSASAQFLLALVAGFSAFAVINALATALRSIVVLSAASALGHGIASNLAAKLYRLPLTWFDARHAGDILSRFQSVGPIREFLTRGSVEVILDGFLTLFMLVVMVTYDARLAMVTAAALLIYGAARFYAFVLERRTEESVISLGGQDQSVMLENMRAIATIRTYGLEAQRHSLWKSRMTDTVNAQLKFGRITALLSASKVLVTSLETVVVVGIAISAVISGTLTVGMVFAYLAYKTIFLDRGFNLVDQLTNFRLLGLHLERLADIALADDDESCRPVTVPARKLQGRVELLGVTFRYGSGEPDVLRDVSFSVSPGEHVAITGPSGGGKSTLLKVILGLLEPSAGKLLIDGLPLREFGFRNFRSQIGVVLQQDNLFAGSVRDNITLFDANAGEEAIVAAATQAAVWDEIERMPMGLDTLVGDMGSTLSGGQKQRLLLARALYRQPQLLVIDEGTSHLDVSKEREINAWMSRLGITRIVVAHRPETVASAERVLVLRDGGIELEK